MRTTLDIDEKLLESVVKLTGEKSKSKAVGKALEEYARRKSMDALRNLAGKIQIDDDWDIWRRTDLGKLRRFDSDDE